MRHSNSVSKLDLSPMTIFNVVSLCVEEWVNQFSMLRSHANVRILHAFLGCVRGYHMYQLIWRSCIGEHSTRTGQNSDHYNACMLLGMCCVVGHIPRETSREYIEIMMALANETL